MHLFSYSAVVLVCKDEGALIHAVRTQTSQTPGLPPSLAHPVSELLSKGTPGKAQEAEAAQLNLIGLTGLISQIGKS